MSYEGRVTEEQAYWLLKEAIAGNLQAVSIGLGSGGHPPSRDGWISLKDGKSVWLSPEGKPRPA